MNINLFLLIIQLLVIATKYSKCGWLEIDKLSLCYDSCQPQNGVPVAPNTEACTNCCKGISSQYKATVKGICKRSKRKNFSEWIVNEGIHCYCNIPVTIKEIPSCKAECKDMSIIPYKRWESCETCCKTFNQATSVKAECKRSGFFGMAKTETCYCSFYTHPVVKRAASKRNIRVGGNSRRVVLPINRSSSSSFRRRQLY